MTTEGVPEMELRTARERDIDLLLFEEFVASPEFVAWFLSQIGIADQTRLMRVAHSVIALGRESDLELELEGRIRVLIENKLDAPLQENQANGYRERAKDYVTNMGFASALTVIVAPASYFSDKGSFEFQYRVELEAVVDWFRDSGVHVGPRQRYKLELLSAALECSEPKPPDPEATASWLDYWRVAMRLAPQLNMRKPLAVRRTNAFILFHPPELPKKVSLWHKFPYGHVDLQFDGRGEELAKMSRTFGALPTGMRVEKAGESVVVRIDVPPITIGTRFSAAEAEVEMALGAAVRLLNWHKEKGL